MILHPLRTSLLTLGLFGIASLLDAGEPSLQTAEVIEAEAPSSILSGSLHVTFASQYVTYGLFLENQGLIGQPGLDLSLSLYEGDGFLSKMSLDMGVWSSLHSRQTDAPPESSAPAWYEFDYTAGIAFTFAKYFTLTPGFLMYLSPSNAFDTFYGVNLRLDFDDSHWLGAFALRPHVAYVRELEGKTGSGTREGNYYEVGMTPGLPEMGPVTVSFPLVAGFGSGEFYEDNTGFGYFSATVDTSVALGFIPTSYGQWAVSAAVSYYYLNGSLATFNVPNVRSAGHHEFVFSGGIGVSF